MARLHLIRSLTDRIEAIEAAAGVRAGRIVFLEEGQDASLAQAIHNGAHPDERLLMLRWLSDGEVAYEQ